MFLYGSKNTIAAFEDLSLWELGVYEWSKSYNERSLSDDSYNFLVQLLVFGNNILDMEINADNRKVAPYFGAGFALMIAIVVFCVFSGAYYNDALDFGKMLEPLINDGWMACPPHGAGSWPSYEESIVLLSKLPGKMGAYRL
ncbi:unnamed protein product [Strongylus vulgaris]|uniref:Uncharacterized protein n=1 Tax=Strongylus vulgaris TaxID=40348 RepID=A0A3P7JCC4_STRVU|nr:unnamed protein product [Strongylus vulgaris]